MSREDVFDKLETLVFDEEVTVSGTFDIIVQKEKLYFNIFIVQLKSYTVDIYNGSNFKL